MLSLFGRRSAAGRRKLLAREYARQHAALDAEHHRAGVDIFISPFDIVKENDGTELSYCTWPEGVRAWLPRTDCVALTGKQAGRLWFFIVRWEDLHAICPNALVPVAGIVPERLQTAVWPGAEELTKLKARAVIKQ